MYKLRDSIDKETRKLNWKFLGNHNKSLDLILKYPQKINSYCSPENLLEQNPEKINWHCLSACSDARAIELLKQNPEKINWINLSLNSDNWAIDLLEKTPNEINWIQLSRNKNSYVNKLLEKNPEKLDWNYLSKNIDLSNKSNMSLLEKNINKINWRHLSLNPSIFELDYEGMKENISVFKEELIQKVNHPSRIQKLLDMGYEIEDIEDYL